MVLPKLKRRLNAKNTLSDHDSIHRHRNLNYTERSMIARHRNFNVPKICKITVHAHFGDLVGLYTGLYSAMGELIIRHKIMVVTSFVSSKEKKKNRDRIKRSK